MNTLSRLKRDLADVTERIRIAEDMDNLPALENLYAVANDLNRRIKLAEPYTPKIRIPAVNYMTGRLIW